jgi:hypothetical protein
VLLEPGSLGGAADDVRERRLLKPASSEPTEDGILRRRPYLLVELSQLVRELWREWLPTRLAALTPANEQRRLRGVEREVAPVERDQFAPP